MKALSRAACVVVLVALASKYAQAAAFESSIDDFHLDFSPAGATLCVVWPAAETKSEDCAGVDVGAVRSALPGLDRAIVVRHGAKRYLITEQTTRTVAGRTWAEGIDDAVANQYPGVSIRNRNPEIMIHRRIGSAEVMRYELVVGPLWAGAEPIELVSYLIPGKSAHHVLQIQEGASLAAIARKDVEEALPGLRVKISAFALLWVTFEKVRFYLLGIALLGGAAFTALLLKKRNQPRSG